MITLVARREVTERVRERSFMVSTGITIVIVVLAVVLPSLLGFGGADTYTIRADDAAGQAVVERAVALQDDFDIELTVTDGAADVIVGDGAIQTVDPAGDSLVSLLQVANLADVEASPALEVRSDVPEDPDRDAKAGIAFFVVLILYAQLLTYGYWVASGVVEEKASRVIEVLLATIRPKDLLTGKVIGLGILGLGQLLIISALGLALSTATGSVDVDADLVGAIVLSLVWFVLGYAFYSSAFAVAGALVPRQEELQSSTTPLTMVILISLFVGFAVQDDPEGTLAHVTAFIPMTAPITMPPRIILGAAPAWEIAASVAVMIVSTLALLPLAGRIYAAVVLRTGSAVKLREALRLARAP